MGVFRACAGYDDFHSRRLICDSYYLNRSYAYMQVHAIFGYTLMLAGVTRIIEISFIVPKYSPLPDSASTDDNHSEHTLADTPASGNIGLMQTVMAFRHLPPFVSSTLALN